jgi:hypothetical protein
MKQKKETWKERTERRKGLPVPEAYWVKKAKWNRLKHEKNTAQ